LSRNALALANVKKGMLDASKLTEFLGEAYEGLDSPKLVGASSNGKKES